jgi:hypothetical protein
MSCLKARRYRSSLGKWGITRSGFITGKLTLRSFQITWENSYLYIEKFTIQRSEIIARGKLKQALMNEALVKIACWAVAKA